MKKNTLRLFALMLSIVMLLSFASCKKKEEDPTETESTEETDSLEETDTVDESETVDDTQESAEPSSGEGEETEPTVGGSTSNAPFELNSSNAAEVLALYKKITKPEVNDGMNAGQKITLNEKITGKGLVATIVKLAQPIVDIVLKQNETDYTWLPGDPQKLTEADIVTAKATSDGQTTIINMTFKEQTDGIDGKVHEGPVGRSISVLDGIDGVIKDLTDNGLKIDMTGGSVTLTYKNAELNVKVDNKTGKIVEGEWKHYTHAEIKNVKIMGLKAEELKAVLLFEVKTK